MDTPTKSAITQDSRLHFLDYWRIIRIRKTIIFAVFLLILLTAIGVTYWMPQLFASTTRMRVEKDTPDIGPIAGLTLPQNNYDPYWLLTEFEVIQSSTILYPVIQKLQLDQDYAKRYKQDQPFSIPDTYQYLSKDVDIKQFRNTTIIEVKAYHPDREKAAQIAEAIAEEYRTYRDSDRTKRAERGQTVLGSELARMEVQVGEARKVVEDLRQRLKIPDLVMEDSSRTATLDANKMVHYEQLRAEAEANLTQNQEMLDRIRTKRGPELVALLAATSPLPELTTTIAKLNDAQQTMAGFENDLGPEHPQVKKVQNIIATLQSQLDDQVAGIIAAKEVMVAKDRALVEKVTTFLNDAIEKSVQQNREYAPYYKAKRELEDKIRLLTVLHNKSWAEKLDASIGKSSSVTIIAHAEPATRPVKPNKPLNIALGTLVGLLVGIALAFFIEYLDTSVKTIDDVEQALGSPVLGVIPQNVGALINEGPDSPHAEAYRVLRTNVLFSRKDPNLRTITVVSGGAGEGKSTTIFNLATIFAQMGSRVLIVDSDLRRPSLHKILNVSNALGLTNYLLNQNKLEEVIQTTKLQSFDFLPSGKLPSSSMGILTSNRMKEFIQEVRNRYDFVFFDSPPIMGVSDASTLASEADMCILVVQYRKYPQQMTLRAKQTVEKVGGRLLGVVLNNINISQDSYYYYYSGYYYDYYSKNDDSKPNDEKKKSKRGGGSGGGSDTDGGSKGAGLDLKQKY